MLLKDAKWHDTNKMHVSMSPLIYFTNAKYLNEVEIYLNEVEFFFRKKCTASLLSRGSHGRLQYIK